MGKSQRWTMALRAAQRHRNVFGALGRFLLDLDEPYWAFTSAAVVSFPTVGGVISKSIGRIAGSLLGAAASVLIAGQCLNDPWLFTFISRPGLQCAPTSRIIIKITLPTLLL